MCPFSFPIIPWFRSFVVLKTVWNNIHACFICTGDRTSDGKKFKHATAAVSGQNIIDVRPFACFFSYFSVPTRHRVVLMLYVLKCFLFSFSMYKYVVLPPLNYTRFIPFLGVMVAEFCSLWQQNDTIQMLLCLIPPRCFAYPVSPCHRFRPFRCTSFLLFVVFSPHSSLLASAVTAVVLRVLMLFFLCLALFVLLSVLLAVICARPLHFFCSFLLLCSTITESLLYVQQLQQRQGHYKNVHRKNQARRSRGQGLGPRPPPPLLLEAAVGRHHQEHPGHQTNSQGARDDPRARVGEAARNRPGHLQGLLRCAASYFSSQTSKTICRRPPPKI